VNTVIGIIALIAWVGILLTWWKIMDNLPPHEPTQLEKDIEADKRRGNPFFDA